MGLKNNTPSTAIKRLWEAHHNRSRTAYDILSVINCLNVVRFCNSLEYSRMNVLILPIPVLKLISFGIPAITGRYGVVLTAQ